MQRFKFEKKYIHEILKCFFRDSFIDRNELVAHIFKALYSMDAEEAGEEFIDADQDGDGKGIADRMGAN